MNALPADPVGRAFVQMLARDRYERWLLSEVESLLLRGLTDVVRLLVTDYSDIAPSQIQRRARLFAQIAQLLAEHYGNGRDFMQTQMKSYAGIEAKATVAHFKSLVADSPAIEVTLQNLTKAEVKAIAEFPIAGLGIGEWFEKQATDMNVATRGQIQLGLLNGEGPAAIARRIVPGAGQIVTGAVEPRARRAALALVRTTTTTVQTQAAYETMRNIDDKLVSSYRYVAVRDGRTTPICRALDGKVFKFSDPKAKRPPQHVNCRSTIVAVVDYGALGLHEPNTVQGGFTMGSYAEWLRSIPKADQNTFLGESAAALFRDGRASLADLVTSDGRRMTNKALATLYGTAA